MNEINLFLHSHKPSTKVLPLSLGILLSCYDLHHIQLPPTLNGCLSPGCKQKCGKQSVTKFTEIKVEHDKISHIRITNMKHSPHLVKKKKISNQKLIRQQIFFFFKCLSLLTVGSQILIPVANFVEDELMLVGFCKLEITHLAYTSFSYSCTKNLQDEFCKLVKNIPSLSPPTPLNPSD